MTTYILAMWQLQEKTFVSEMLRCIFNYERSETSMEIVIFSDHKEDCNDLIVILQRILKQVKIRAHVKVKNEIDTLFKDSYECDLIFLDMDMKSMSGLDIGKQVKKRHPECRIVITSAFDQYAKQGYKIHADRFLSKPFDESELLRELTDYFDEFFRDLRYIKDPILNPTTIFIRDILYVEAVNKRTRIHMIKDKLIYTPYTLKYWIAELERSSFFQSHKAFYVNLKYVDKLTNTDVVLSSGELVPLSRKFRKEFEKKYFENLYKTVY